MEYETEINVYKEKESEVSSPVWIWFQKHELLRVSCKSRLKKRQGLRWCFAALNNSNTPWKGESYLTLSSMIPKLNILHEKTMAYTRKIQQWLWNYFRTQDPCISRGLLRKISRLSFHKTSLNCLFHWPPLMHYAASKLKQLKKKWWLEVQFKSMALFSIIKKAMKAVAVRMIACKKLVLIAQQSVVSCQLCPIVFFLVPVKWETINYCEA